MPEDTPIDWIGQSGKKYRCTLHPLGTKVKAGPGAYIFAKQTAYGWAAVYMGQCEDVAPLALDHSQHEKHDCISSRGATHISILRDEAGEQVRLEAVQDLVDRYGPSCNLDGQ